MERSKPVAASDEAQADTFRTVLEHTVNLVPVVNERQTITPSAPSVEPAKGHETILLVEDDDTGRRLVTTQMKRQGYRVLTAADGESALDQVSRAGDHWKLDLVVSNVVMPGMSGPEPAVHLREKLPTLPILFISGYTGALTVQHGFCEGKDQLLNKPFIAKTLAERVRSLLDRPPSRGLGRICSTPSRAAERKTVFQSQDVEAPPQIGLLGHTADVPDA